MTPTTRPTPDPYGNRPHYRVQTTRQSVAHGQPVPDDQWTPAGMAKTAYLAGRRLDGIRQSMRKRGVSDHPIRVILCRPGQMPVDKTAECEAAWATWRTVGLQRQGV